MVAVHVLFEDLDATVDAMGEFPSHFVQEICIASLTAARKAAKGKGLRAKNEFLKQFTDGEYILESESEE